MGGQGGFFEASPLINNKEGENGMNRKGWLPLAALLLVLGMAGCKETEEPPVTTATETAETTKVVWKPQMPEQTVPGNVECVYEEGRGELYITGYRGVLPAHLTLPNVYDGKPVTQILDEAFKNCTELVSVTIPEGIRFVGISAFEGCSNLTGVSFPASTKIITSYAFRNCTSLTGVTIPEGVLWLTNNVFEGCTALREVQLPESLVYLGSDTFRGTPWLDAQTEEFVILNDTLLLKYNGSESHVEIPGNVKRIVDAFAGCTFLESVTIPEGVIEIGDGAFSGCTGLQQAELPGSVTSIGNDAFYGCTALNRVNIPDGVTWLGSQAFRECENLTEITIPGAIRSIFSYTFLYCKGLERVNISQGVELIQKNAFLGCGALGGVSIPRGCEVEEEAFPQFCKVLFE